MIVIDTGGLMPPWTPTKRCMAEPWRLWWPRDLLASSRLSCSPSSTTSFGTREGHKAQLALADEVQRGAYRLEPFTAEDLGHARRVVERCADVQIGLADASVVVIAHRHRALDLLCTDLRT